MRTLATGFYFTLENRELDRATTGRPGGPLTPSSSLLPQPRAMMKTLSSGNCTLSVPAKNSYRMVVLGASRVGKSSIVSRFLNGRFEDQYTPTIEDFHRKVYNIHGDMYQLDILDTSGNHPFPAMRRLSILTGEVMEGTGSWPALLFREVASCQTSGGGVHSSICPVASHCC